MMPFPERAAGRIVILGAGQAGLQAAVSLREAGHAGSIVLVGEEEGLPYQRPPLSKAYLLGKATSSQLELRTAAVLAELRIDLICDPAVAIDRTARLVRLRSGRGIGYDHLVLAVGARRRELSVAGSDLAGVHYLRTRADAARLKQDLGAARRALVIGGGFIGLEFAAVAAELGLACTVIEAAPVLLGRAVSRTCADHIGAFHAGRGVTLRLGETIAAFEGGPDGRLARAVTNAGDAVEADLAVIGVGVLPNAELAAKAGLALVEGGIAVDAFLSTSDPTISAIGDCAIGTHPLAGRPVRIESVQNAVDQARCLAAKLTGTPRTYAAVPWFWSDQGAMKLQIVGLTQGHDRTVLRGDPASARFSVFCYRGDRLLGIESINRPADHMAGRRLVGTPHAPTPHEAADAAFDLKARLAAAGG